MTITIVAREAADIASHVRTYIKPGARWSEVQVMRHCAHGCKLYVRRQGAVTQYRLMHSAAYGCRLAHNPETAVVKVSVAPKAKDPWVCPGDCEQGTREPSYYEDLLAAVFAN
jgi:hypothetical protein